MCGICKTDQYKDSYIAQAINQAGEIQELKDTGDRWQIEAESIDVDEEFVRFWFDKKLYEFGSKDCDCEYCDVGTHYWMFEIIDTDGKRDTRSIDPLIVLNYLKLCEEEAEKATA
jgi:hypothetical protein